MEFAGATLWELLGGSEDDFHLAAIGGDFEGRENCQTGAITAVVALHLDLALLGGDELWHASGLDEGAAGALEG